MSFGDHLEELRYRLLLALAAPVPLMIIMFFFSGQILEWIMDPLVTVLRSRHLPETLQALGPAEALMTSLKISIIAALILCAPWIIWQLWKFVQPGLYSQERRFVYFLLPGSAILTAAAVALLYFVMLPLVLSVLVNFGTKLSPEDEQLPQGTTAQQVQPPAPAEVPILTQRPEELTPGMMWLTPRGELRMVVQVDDGQPVVLRVRMTTPTLIGQSFQLHAYVNFVLLLMLGLVIGFQTPLVVLLLGWVGLISPQTLRKRRKHAFFILAIVSTVLTPADPWSMIAMLIPLYLLYELGIILLVLAPAHRVAAGTVFRRDRQNVRHTGREQSDQASQPDRTSQSDERFENDEPNHRGDSSDAEEDQP